MKRIALLDNILYNRLPCTAPTRWNFTSKLVSTVLSNKDYLTNVLVHILDSECFVNTSIMESLSLKHLLLA